MSKETLTADDLDDLEPAYGNDAVRGELLPKSEWYARRDRDGTIYIRLYDYGKYLILECLDNDDLPDDLVSSDDLERALANESAFTAAYHRVFGTPSLRNPSRAVGE
jgi:hypothetical protein